MLTVHGLGPAGKLIPMTDPYGCLDSGSAVWIDLLRPTLEEEAAVERALHLDVPVEAEREALETSARFWVTADELYLTATLVTIEDDRPRTGAVTFILRDRKLITVRSIEPRAFRFGEGRAALRTSAHPDGAAVLLALLDGVAERLADIADETSEALDQIGDAVFDGGPRQKDLRPLLKRLGVAGSRASKIRESTSSLSRLAAVAQAAASQHDLDSDRLKVLARDLREIDGYAGSLSERLLFLLDATLGLIAGEQNQSVRAMSIVAVLFLPPTLIASIYGMNFDFMPELKQAWGYPAALIAMLTAAVALFVISKRNRWL